MAAMPMLIPRADSKARARRLRSPRLPTRRRSRQDSRIRRRQEPGRRVTDDLPVSDLDAPFQAAATS